MSSNHPITVLGATGKVGRAFTGHMAATDWPLIAVGRDRAKLATMGGAETRVADFGDRDALMRALADARIVVSCAHARFVPALLPALPQSVVRVVLMGSARKFTRFPDEAARDVQIGEAAFLSSGCVGVMIMPTMIYGRGAENNLVRMAAYIRRFGLVPLPRGGRSLMQPIHLDDVVCVLKRAATSWDGPATSVVIAGGSVVTYADLVRAVARAMRLRVHIVPMPAPLLLAASWATGVLPGVPRIAGAEVRRLLEDKNYDISEMRARFGVEPLSLEAGLARTFGCA